MAATYQPQSTIRDFTRESGQPEPVTLEALSSGLRFLDSENQDSNAGWRQALTPETLATVLDVDVHTASDLYRGKRRWRKEDRARVAGYLRSA